MPWVSFLKDVLFVQLILGFIILFNIYGRINVWMGLSFLGLYVLYVVATLLSAKPQKDKTLEEVEVIDTNRARDQVTEAELPSPRNDKDSEE